MTYAVQELPAVTSPLSFGPKYTDDEDLQDVSDEPQDFVRVAFSR